MECHGGHGMHVGFRNVLDHDRYVIVPRPDRLIVRGGHEATVFVDERDRVHRPQVLVVLLRDLARVHVILAASGEHRLRGTEETDLDDLLVRHAGEKDVLLVVVGVEAHDIGGLAIAEAVEALAGLGVP